MNDTSKLLWNVLGVFLAAAIGFWVASYSLKDLNVRVSEAYQNLGAVIDRTEVITIENAKLIAKQGDLSEKAKHLDDTIMAVEATLGKFRNSENGKFVASLEALAQYPDVNKLLEKVQALSDQVSNAHFGAWRTDFQPNVAYQASEDGFVAAVTGGNPPKDTQILSGSQPDKLVGRARAVPYAGTVLPVARGQYWKVQTQGGPGISVQWLPAP